MFKIDLYKYIIFITLGCLNESAQINAQVLLQGGKISKVNLSAKSTGRTTGHIADLSVKNTSAIDIDEEIGPFYIPASGNYQPYIVPFPVRIIAKAGDHSTIPVMGFCTDNRRPPVPSGESMPSPDSWIIPDQITEDWEPDSQDGWVKTFEILGDGKFVTKPGYGVFLSVPGTEKPLGHTIDQYKHPKEAAPLILNGITRIITSTDSLQQQGNIRTPFSNNKDKEREAVIQQTFWIFTAMLTGNDYTKDEFRDIMVKQLETQSGRSYESSPVAVKEKIDQGVDDFWDSFMLVGAEAKILPSIETSTLPHRDELEKYLGKDISEVKPHNPPVPSDSLGSQAYALGDKVEMKAGDPSHHTAAHEVAHVVQQRAGEEGVNAQANTDEKKEPCKCMRLTGSLSVNRGLGEDVAIDIDLEKVSPEQKIAYQRVNFDKSGKQNPEAFTVSFKNLRLNCICPSGACDTQAAERDKYDKDEEKFSAAIVRFGSDVKVEGKTKVKCKNGHSFSFTTTASSENIELSFSISAYCTSEACRHDYCKASVKLSFKEEKEDKKEPQKK